MSEILVCTDGSSYSEPIYAYAAWAAKRLNHSIAVLHVLDHHREHADSANWSGNMSANEREELLAELAELDEKKSRLLQARGRDILKAAKHFFTENGIDAARLTLKNGSFTDIATDVGASAAMVVIGKRGEDAASARNHLGSNLERLVRASKQPVLVANRAYRDIKKVLIAYDGSRNAFNALDHIVQTGLINDLDRTILMAGPDTPHNHKALNEAAEKIAGLTGGPGRFELKPGAADDVICKAVRDQNIDLLVVGAYGHSRIRRLFVGSTTTELVRSCRIPVLMVR